LELLIKEKQQFYGIKKMVRQFIKLSFGKTGELRIIVKNLENKIKIPLYLIKPVY